MVTGLVYVVQFCLLAFSWSDSDFANHLYDYRLDWTQLSSLTIINNKNFVIEHKRIIAIITGEEKLVDQWNQFQLKII